MLYLAVKIDPFLHRTRTVAGVCSVTFSSSLSVDRFWSLVLLLPLPLLVSFVSVCSTVRCQSIPHTSCSIFTVAGGRRWSNSSGLKRQQEHTTIRRDQQSTTFGKTKQDVNSLCAFKLDHSCHRTSHALIVWNCDISTTELQVFWVGKPGGGGEGGGIHELQTKTTAKAHALHLDTLVMKARQYGYSRL